MLPTTTGLYTWIAIAPRADRTLRVFSCIFDSMEDIDLDRIKRSAKTAQWCEYVKGVASILEGCRLFPARRRHRHRWRYSVGRRAQFVGVPRNRARIRVARLCRMLRSTAAKLAQLCQRAETDFVGIRCGIMDQYVISRCANDRAMMLDCRSLEFQSVAMPADARLLVVDTGVSHRLPVGEYNSRREECEKAVALLASEIPQLGALRDLDLAQLEDKKKLLDDRHYRRCRHIVSEIQRVKDAYSALQRGDVANSANSSPHLT